MGEENKAEENNKKYILTLILETTKGKYLQNIILLKTFLLKWLHFDSDFQDTFIYKL